jgi:hypothetical protein
MQYSLGGKLRFPLPENDNKIFKKTTKFCDIFLTRK